MLGHKHESGSNANICYQTMGVRERFCNVVDKCMNRMFDLNSKTTCKTRQAVMKQGNLKENGLSFNISQMLATTTHELRLHVYQRDMSDTFQVDVWNICQC